MNFVVDLPAERLPSDDSAEEDYLSLASPSGKLRPDPWSAIPRVPEKLADSDSFVEKRPAIRISNEVFCGGEHWIAGLRGLNWFYGGGAWVAGLRKFDWFFNEGSKARSPFVLPRDWGDNWEL